MKKFIETVNIEKFKMMNKNEKNETLFKFVEDSVQSFEYLYDLKNGGYTELQKTYADKEDKTNVYCLNVESKPLCENSKDFTYSAFLINEKNPKERIESDNINFLELLITLEA